MKRIHIDMDRVLANFDHGVIEHRKVDANLKYPQSKEGFFKNLKPIDNAIDAYNFLDKYFDVWILTAPSVLNPLCYTEKRLWVEEHLGIERCHKLIIAPDKSLLKGDYLIDDSITKGQLEFEGRLIHFGQEGFETWDKVVSFFTKLIKRTATLDLDIFKPKNNTVFSGYELGRRVALESNITEFAARGEDIKIVIPAWCNSVNPSFLEGLLRDIFSQGNKDKITIDSQRIDVGRDFEEAFSRFKREDDYLKSK